MIKDGYKRKYAQMITDHFSGLLKDGEAVVGIPSFVSFSKEIGVSGKTFESWKRSHGDFSDACDECLERQKQIVIDGAFCKKIDSTFAKYYLSAVFGLGEEKTCEDMSISSEDKKLLENIKRRLDNE